MRLSISWDCLKQLLDPPRFHFFFFERPRISPWSFPPSIFCAFFSRKRDKYLVHVDLICCLAKLGCACVLFVSSLSQVISSPPHQPPLFPKKNPDSVQKMRWDERWKSFSRLLKRLWQKKRRKRKDSLLIRGVWCAHTGLICLVTARNYLFFSFDVRKRRNKLSSPSKQHWRLGGIFFFQREWTENLGFKVLV